MASRVGFAILCHDNPLQLTRLLSAFAERDNPIAIHVDPKSPAIVGRTALAAASSLPNATVWSEVSCAWGGWSLVAVTLKAFDRLLAMEPALTHICVLSGTHHPVISPGDWIGSLPHRQSIVDSAPFPSLEGYPNVSPWAAELGQRVKVIYSEVDGVGPIRMRPRTEDDLINRFYTGSQWMILSTEHLKRFLDDDYAAAVKFFSQTLIPDEMFFQTMLARKVPETEIVRRQMTFARFARDGRPEILSFAEMPEIRSKGYFFARKFTDSATVGGGDCADGQDLPMAGQLRAKVERVLQRSLTVPGEPDLPTVFALRDGKNKIPDQSEIAKNAIMKIADSIVDKRSDGPRLRASVWHQGMPFMFAVQNSEVPSGEPLLMIRTATFYQFSVAICIQREHFHAFLAKSSTRLADGLVLKANGREIRLATSDRPMVNFWPWVNVIAEGTQYGGIENCSKENWSRNVESFLEKWTDIYSDILDGMSGR